MTLKTPSTLRDRKKIEVGQGKMRVEKKTNTFCMPTTYFMIMTIVIFLDIYLMFVIFQALFLAFT